MSSEGVKMISCKIYEHKESAAAHVVVPFDKKDTVLNADIWTEGVRIRNWSFDNSAFRKIRNNDVQKVATKTIKFLVISMMMIMMKCVASYLSCKESCNKGYIIVQCL